LTNLRPLLKASFAGTVDSCSMMHHRARTPRLAHVRKMAVKSISIETQIKMKTQIDKIQSVIDAKNSALDAELAKTAKRKADIAAASNAEAEKLIPLRDSLSNLRVKLGGLTAKRDEIIEALRIGRGQLAAQVDIAAQFDEIAAKIFGKHGGNGDMMNQVKINGMLPLASFLVTRYTALIEDKQGELETVEAEIVALSESSTIAHAE
jgi:hypothetical protein